MNLYMGLRNAQVLNSPYGAIVTTNRNAGNAGIPPVFSVLVGATFRSSTSRTAPSKFY